MVQIGTRLKSAFSLNKLFAVLLNTIRSFDIALLHYFQVPRDGPLQEEAPGRVVRADVLPDLHEDVPPEADERRRAPPRPHRHHPRDQKRLLQDLHQAHEEQEGGGAPLEDAQKVRDRSRIGAAVSRLPAGGHQGDPQRPL